MADVKDKAAQNDAYFDTIWSDDMYLQQIEQYKDNPELYDYLLKNNPHLRSKNARFETDPLTGLFNYQGAAATYYGNMRSDSNAWVERQVDKWREQEYDSPAAQAQRESAAGLNPDLLGNVTPGAAAENDNLAPASYQNGTSATGMQIAQAGIGLISNIIGFGKQLQELNIGAASLVAQDLENNQSAFDFGVNAVAGLSDLRDKVVDNSDILDDPSFPNLIRESVKGSQNRFTVGFRKSTRKLVNAWFDRLEKGDPLAIQAVRSKLRKDTLENNQVSAEIMSNPWYSDDFNEWIGNIGEKFSKFVAITNEYQARAAASYAQTEGEFAEKSSTQKTYGSVLGGELSARDMSAAGAIEYQKYQKTMNEVWNELEALCKPEVDEKTGKPGHRKWYHTIGAILIMALRSQFSQPFHFGFNSSQSDNGRGGSSSSFGLHF